MLVDHDALLGDVVFWSHYLTNYGWVGCVCVFCVPTGAHHDVRVDGWNEGSRLDRHVPGPLCMLMSAAAVPTSLRLYAERV